MFVWREDYQNCSVLRCVRRYYALYIYADLRIIAVSRILFLCNFSWHLFPLNTWMTVYYLLLIDRFLALT